MSINEELTKDFERLFAVFKGDNFAVPPNVKGYFLDFFLAGAMHITMRGANNSEKAEFCRAEFARLLERSKTSHDARPTH